MKLHTDVIEREHIVAAARVARVGLSRCERKGSRSKDHAWDLILTGSSRHRPNGGTSNDDYAATWDEWGIFLNILFEYDFTLKSQAYLDRWDFHRKTGGRYATLAWEDQHQAHKWEWAGISNERECECGAVQRW